MSENQRKQVDFIRSHGFTCWPVGGDCVCVEIPGVQRIGDRLLDYVQTSVIPATTSDTRKLLGY